MITKHSASEILEQDLSWQTTYPEDYRRYKRAIAEKYIAIFTMILFCIAAVVLIVEALNIPSMSTVLWVSGGLIGVLALYTTILAFRSDTQVTDWPCPNCGLAFNQGAFNHGNARVGNVSGLGNAGGYFLLFTLLINFINSVRGVMIDTCYFCKFPRYPRRKKAD